MATYYKSGNTFTVAYRLKGRKREYVYGIGTEKLAQRIRNAKGEDEMLSKAGLLKIDPNAERYAKAEQTPMSEHLENFRKSIIAKGSSEEHAKEQEGRAKRVLDRAKIVRLSGLEPGPVQQAAAEIKDEVGRAPRTANAHLAAVKQFSTWLKGRKLIPLDVLRGEMARFNEAVDIRRKRREMTDEEIAWLLDTTPAQNRRAGLSGEDRGMLYLTGLSTGFRQKGLLSLVKASFKVDATLTRPTVTLLAKSAKGKKEMVQPIPRAAATRLRTWLEKKPDTGPVFRAAPWGKYARMFRRDMEAARAAWLENIDDPAERKKAEKSGTLKYEHDDGTGKVYADFHGLRHTGISRVVRAAGLPMGQKWAGHVHLATTAKYAHPNLGDETRAMEALDVPEAPAVRKRETKGKTA